MKAITDKEWTDHQNGHRYYIEYINDKVKVRISKYPEGDNIFKTECDRDTFKTFIDYLKEDL